MIRPDLLIFGLALVIRLIYLSQYYGTPFYLVPMWDAGEYHSMAVALSEGQLHPAFAYRPFLYPLFLGMVYIIFGVGLLVPRLVQIVIGSLICVFVMRIGGRLYGRTAGIIAGVLSSLSGMMFFYDLELSPTTPAILLMLLGLWELLKVMDDEETGRRGRLPAHLRGVLPAQPKGVLPVQLMPAQPKGVLPAQLRPVQPKGSAPKAGIYLGLGALMLPTMLTLLVIGALWLWLSAKMKVSDIIRFVMWGVAPIIVSLMLHIVAGYGPVVVSANGGVNFYVGNNRYADGITANMPGIGAGWNWEIIQQMAQAKSERIQIHEGGHPRSPRDKMMTVSEVDRFYWREGIREITADPVRWVGLMVRKGALFWNRIEISSNRDIYYHAERFPLFGLLMMIGFSTMLSPAFIGLLSGWRNDKRVQLLAISLVMYYIITVLFFVNARFRHPVTPLLFIFAAGGMMQIVRWIRKLDPMPFKTVGVVAIAVILGLILPYVVDSGVDPDRWDYGLFTEGSALERLGRMDEAERAYIGARDANPNAPYVNFKLGELAAKRGALRQAIDYYRRELEIQPTFSKVWNNLGIIQLESGDEGSALNSFLRATEGRPPVPEAYRNAARIWGTRGVVAMEVGDWSYAIECFSEAKRLSPDDPYFEAMLLKVQMCANNS
ncbi:MAG: tetratricopeptide repeat protein [Candidatus Electryoneaceae bacterium]|nr:tetratricopeptide repeat protein [Candidatus Electryoneaceae bacterium]